MHGYFELQQSTFPHGPVRARFATAEALESAFKDYSACFSRAQTIKGNTDCHLLNCAYQALVLITASVLMQITRLKFEPEHGQSYNDLVEVIVRNLLLADWWDEDHSESLLAPRNSKWGAEMLRNVR